MKPSLTPQEGKSVFFCHLKKGDLWGLFVWAFVWLGGVLLCGFFYPNPIHNKHWHLPPKEKEQSMAKCHPTYTLI